MILHEPEISHLDERATKALGLDIVACGYVRTQAAIAELRALAGPSLA
jgi:hypothetical protein